MIMPNEESIVVQEDGHTFLSLEELQEYRNQQAQQQTYRQGTY
jgi:hypothetical protein